MQMTTAFSIINYSSLQKWPSDVYVCIISEDFLNYSIQKL